jgi:hypothetical protein
MQLHNFPGFAAAVLICLSVTRSDITKEITQTLDFLINTDHLSVVVAFKVPLFSID